MTYTLPSAPPTTHWGPPLTTSKSITLPHSSTPTLAPFVPYSPQAPLGRIADWNHDPTTTTQDSYNDNNENNNHNNRRHNNNNNTGAQNNRNRHLETYNAYGMMQNGTGIGYTHENEDRSFEVVDNRTNVSESYPPMEPDFIDKKIDRKKLEKKDMQYLLAKIVY